jgi:hypothetical protein
VQQCTGAFSLEMKVQHFEDQSRILAGILALAIRPMTGYVENGSSQRFSVWQDDATKDWFVSCGTQTHCSNSLTLALEMALASGEYP